MNLLKSEKQDSQSRLRIQELEKTIALTDNKKNENVTILKSNWREIKRLIKTNWANFKLGQPQLSINTSFASSTEVIPVYHTNLTVIFQSSLAQYTTPTAPLVNQ
jgi:hypothetical protein